MIDLNQLEEVEIQQRLAQAHSEFPEDGFVSAFLADAPRPAAVLVPLLRASIDGSNTFGWHILLTKRSANLAEHSGQVAFPGGRADPDDPSPEATALREAYEEIGLESKNVKILGSLDSLLTITNYSITPIVGVIPWPLDFKLADLEVDHVFTIPLDWLAKSDNHETRLIVLPPPHSLHFGNESHPVIYFHPYNGDILWGVSAEITMRLLRILLK